jgi:hypothetical protein
MPNIPKTGIEFSGDQPPVGKDEHGPPAPSHGAAGGYDIPMSTHGASPQMRPEKNITTGLTTNDPEFGC